MWQVWQGHVALEWPGGEVGGKCSFQRWGWSEPMLTAENSFRNNPLGMMVLLHDPRVSCQAHGRQSAPHWLSCGTMSSVFLKVTLANNMPRPACSNAVTTNFNDTNSQDAEKSLNTFSPWALGPSVHMLKGEKVSLLHRMQISSLSPG